MGARGKPVLKLKSWNKQIENSKERRFMNV